MADFNFLPVSTDAWVADTAHLGRAERGLYWDLLVLMWRSPECRVPNEIEWIARKLGCRADEVETLKSILSEFCRSSGNWLTQKRLHKEWQYVRAKSEKQRAAANARWNKEKEGCKRNADWHNGGNAPTPTPTPSIPLDKSNGQKPFLEAVQEPVHDPAKIMFDAGLAILCGSGQDSKKARGILGKWKQAHGVEAVIAAISRAKREGAIEPVAFIEGCFRAKRQSAGLPSIDDVAPML